MARLPSLKGLQTFEVVSRHLSFTRAADELSVTPAAVCQQMRNLEEELETQLFRRTTRQLHLSDDREGCPPCTESVQEAGKRPSQNP